MRNGFIEYADGSKLCNQNGNKYWHKNGVLHKTNGPAIEYVWGAKEWYQNGDLHREDGPAIEYDDDGYNQWWVNGVNIDTIKNLFRSYIINTNHI